MTHRDVVVQAVETAPSANTIAKHGDEAGDLRCHGEVGGDVSHTPPPGRNTYLASQYARIAGRRGSGRAAMAVAHSLLVIAYHVLDRGEPYRELGPD